MADFTLTLDKPLTFDGQPISSLEFREPNGGDIERMVESKGSDLVKSYALMANLAEVDPKLIRALPVRKINEVNSWLEPILDPKDPPAA